jgi:uncharacterized protein YeaO (DUF488 family)
MNNMKVKRIYERADTSDGVRVLVDRIWPRGITKENAQLTVWMKEIAPSNELRQWFGHQPERFVEFKQRYEAELAGSSAQEYVEQLRLWAQEKQVTLLYAAKDEQHNQAVVLLRFLLSDHQHVTR